MSDFLTSLAGRTLGTIPVVVPRQRSRFEPASPGETSAFNEASTESAAASPRAVSEPHRPTHRAETSASSKSSTAPPASQPASRPLVSTPDLPAAFIAAARIESAPTNTAQPTASPALKSNSPENASTSGRVVPATAQLTPRAIHRDSPPATLPKKENAPTIHVSIGRVEVRAIQRVEKPPPPPPAVTPPRNSLGSYLRGSRAPRE